MPLTKSTSVEMGKIDKQNGCMTLNIPKRIEKRCLPPNDHPEN